MKELIEMWMRNFLKYFYRAYLNAGCPFSFLTCWVRYPMRWYYHKSKVLQHDSRQSLKARLLAPLHFALVKHIPKDFLIYNKTIMLRSFGNLMAIQGYYVGEIEYHLVQFVVNKLHPDFIMLDIGAHHGVYTLIVAYELRKRGWQGTIHSFEPDSENYEILKYNVVNNDLSSYVILHNVAVTDSSGAKEFLRSLTDNSGNTLLENQAMALSNSEVQRYVVNTVAIDDLLNQFSGVDLIKLDIQGSEPLALVGAKKTLNTFRPIVVVEAVPQWSSTPIVLEFLDSIGYRTWGVDRNGDVCDMNGHTAFVDWDVVSLSRDKVLQQQRAR